MATNPCTFNVASSVSALKDGGGQSHGPLPHACTRLRSGSLRAQAGNFAGPYSGQGRGLAQPQLVFMALAGECESAADVEGELLQ